jgi:hypothetical protein
MRGQQMHILQNRMADRCKCRQMQADADECTAEQPDMLQNRCFARCIARQPDEQADKLNSEQADLQNRWISRQINAQPTR